jgi:hypothetical protein
MLTWEPLLAARTVARDQARLDPERAPARNGR